MGRSFLIEGIIMGLSTKELVELYQRQKQIEAINKLNKEKGSDGASADGKDNNKNIGCGCLILIVIGAAILGSFLPSSENDTEALPDESQETGTHSVPDAVADESPVSPHYQDTSSPSGPTTADTPQAEPVSLEPDWRARLQYHYEAYQQLFVPPDVGSTVTITQVDGRSRSGELSAITHESVTIRVPGGVLTYQQAQLSQESRTYLFRADFAREKAIMAVKEEQRNYRITQ